MIWLSSSFILNLFNCYLFNWSVWKENAVMNKVCVVKETESILSISMVTMQLPNASDLWESLQSMRRNKRCLPRILEGKVAFSSGYSSESKDDLKMDDRMWRWLANWGRKVCKLWEHRVFSHEVTAAMLVSSTNPTRIELYSCANVFFGSSWKTCSLITWVKTLCIGRLKHRNQKQLNFI